MEGVLEKKTRGGKWHQRLFKVQDGVLEWLKSDNKTAITIPLFEEDKKQTIELRDVKFGLKKFVFEVTVLATSRVISLAATSNQEKIQWMHAIEIAAGLPLSGGASDHTRSPAPKVGKLKKTGFLGGSVRKFARSNASSIASASEAPELEIAEAKPAPEKGDKIMNLQQLLGLSQINEEPDMTKQEVEAQQRLRSKLAGKLVVPKFKQSRCGVCEKVVYKTEEILVDNKPFHKGCFRCEHCKRQLTLSNFAAVNKKLYCKTHYIELFKESGGRYEVFGDAGFKRTSMIPPSPSQKKTIKLETQKEVEEFVEKPLSPSKIATMEREKRKEQKEKLAKKKSAGKKNLDGAKKNGSAVKKNDTKKSMKKSSSAASNGKSPSKQKKKLKETAKENSKQETLEKSNTIDPVSTDESDVTKEERMVDEPTPDDFSKEIEDSNKIEEEVQSSAKDDGTTTDMADATTISNDASEVVGKELINAMQEESEMEIEINESDNNTIVSETEDEEELKEEELEVEESKEEEDASKKALNNDKVSSNKKIIEELAITRGITAKPAEPEIPKEKAEETIQMPEKTPAMTHTVLARPRGPNKTKKKNVTKVGKSLAKVPKKEKPMHERTFIVVPSRGPKLMCFASSLAEKERWTTTIANAIEVHRLEIDLKLAQKKDMMKSLQAQMVLEAFKQEKEFEYQGFLEKCAMKSKKNWKRRYFVLKENKLMFFVNDKKKKPKKIVTFDAKAVVMDAQGNEIRAEIPETQDISVMMPSM